MTQKRLGSWIIHNTSQDKWHLTDFTGAQEALSLAYPVYWAEMRLTEFGKFEKMMKKIVPLMR